MNELLHGLLIVILYAAVLLGLSRLFGVKYTELLNDRSTILKGIIAPVGISSVLLVAYLLLTGKLVTSFTPVITEITWIAWAAPVVILASIILRIPQFNHKKYSLKTFGLLIVATSLVGFSEELLVRGMFASLLGTAGLSAFGIIALSSVVFGALHGINYLNGQDGKTTIVQITLTSLIGVNLFAIMIVSGYLWVAMLAHALYDLSAISVSDQVNQSSGKTSKTSMVVGLLSYVSAIAILISYAFV